MVASDVCDVGYIIDCNSNLYRRFHFHCRHHIAVRQLILNSCRIFVPLETDREKHTHTHSERDREEILEDSQVGMASMGICLSVTRTGDPLCSTSTDALLKLHAMIFVRFKRERNLSAQSPLIKKV